MTGLIALLVMVLKDVSVFTSYVKNNAFPQPLSTAEEKKLVALMSEGDTTARNQLIEHNLRLVAHLTKKYETGRQDSEDLISVGTIGLIKAVEKFHPSRGTKLATFAARCIENEILMYLRKTKKLSRETSLYEPIGTDKDGNELTLVDLYGTEADEIEETVNLTWEREMLYAHLPVLDAREREVISKRFGILDGEEMTQREIAEELGISRSYVSRIERKALNKLHGQFHQGVSH